MPLNLKPTSADEIDAEIWDIYKGRLGGGELKQLSKLFRDAALPKCLKAVLTPTLTQTGSGYSERLDIKVAWIDKRPLAALEGRSWKVELGDAAVFFFDVLEYGGGKMNQRQSRALLLQAKAASQSRQMEKPSVPVNPPNPPPDNSTAHELQLLSQWGKFDLYATSGNKEPAARGIAVKPKTLPPPYGWYMATPQRRPRRGERAAWASPWMCAPAASGAPCDLSLGKLLAAFLSPAGTTAGGSAIPAVGADFKFGPQSQSKPGDDGWDRLCIALLRLCPQNRLPPHLFGAHAGSVIVRSVVRSLPYIGNGHDLPNWLVWIHDLIWPRRMPVLWITITRTEG